MFDHRLMLVALDPPHMCHVCVVPCPVCIVPRTAPNVYTCPHPSHAVMEPRARETEGRIVLRSAKLRPAAGVVGA